MCSCISKNKAKQKSQNVQLETLVKHWRPVVAFRLGRKLAFFVAQVWTDDVDFDKRPKHSVRHPLNVVNGNHCNVNSNTCYTRGSAIAEEPCDALRQLKYYGRF